ncbi:3'-5' DNA helicase [Coemansia sp. RSA 1843]|nr:3'-5' DNA helicase [Coemansia sp. RSA 1843]
MTTANNGNTDDFDDFDLDDISGELLDDLLKDDLEPDIEPTNTTIPPTTHSKATNGTSFQQQQWLQHKPQARVSPKRNGGQQTITSMFTRTAKSASHKHIPQKHPAQSRTGLDSIPVVPAFPSPPRKKPRLEDAQIQEIVDLIELEDDFSEFVSQSRPDTKPSHVKQHHKRPPQMFQTKETVIKNRGDNSLAESLHNMDRDAMRTYVYPLIDGQAARAYQQGAIHRCIFQNTLVALPTGMGKTMVAVVVMANYARWFPNSLSIFLAPTRPLVAQQMKACRGMLRAILKKSDEVHQTTAMQNLLLSSNWIVEMNGSTPPKARETLWNEAKFVFSTPQILQNDLKVGTLSIDNAKRISLLVIDEAHRATGKYAYGESINNLYTINHGREAPDFNPLHPAPPDPFRVMALTATPGSKIEAVREIVQRLHIAHIFLRTEESLDVVAYIHGRQIEEISIEMSPWLAAARDCLATVIGRSTNLLCNVCKAMPDPGDLKRISGFQVRMNRDRFLSHGGGSGSGMDTARISSEFTVLISLAHIMQLLSEHGLRPAWRAIRSWEMEVTRAAYEMGTSSRAKIQCFQSKEWTAMSQEFKFLVDMLDGKQPTTDSTSGSLANTASNSARALVVPSNSTMVGMTGPGGNAIPRRTDVVSNFFNVATKQHLAGNPVTTSASHVRIASLAHPGFLGHPKLERLVQIVKTHFEDSASEADGQSTKIIIFSQYRGSVSEIVDVLVKVSPLVICEQFIGQSSTGGSGGSSANGNSTGGGGRGRGRGRGAWQQSSRGHNGGYFRGRGRGGSSHRGGNHSQAGSGGGGRNSGYNSSDSDGGLLAELEGDVGEMRGQTQKEQLAVMNRFRNGQTNVIVATCVGEEGLDIGEVDLIINYDAPSSPIRMLQRIGRTGRARRGKVIVFLAKDTREENSYKKAQREYKSVQEKIASGRGLDLRADLSPPMVPPTLPPGLPARDEMFISRQEIAQDDAIAEDSGTNGRSKGRGTRKKRTSTDGTSVSKGIDPSEMCEFNQLSAKYRCSPAQPGGTGQNLRVVDRFLARGVAWQSSVSPHCLVSHSHRSTVYRSLMQELENARFNEMSMPGHDSFGDDAYDQKIRLRIPTLAQFMKDTTSSRSVEQSKSHTRPCKSSRTYLINGRNDKAKNKPAGSVAADTPFTLAANSDSDDDLDDTGSILSKRSAGTSPTSHLGFVAAGNRRPFCSHESASATHGKPPANSKILTDRAENFTLVNGRGQTGSNAAATHHKRRSSSQTSILDSIEDLVKSGKAKRAFEWSLGLDDELVRMAKTQGIELGLVDELSDERVDTFDKRASVATGSIFGDIGQPGAFDKLYDKDRVMRSTAADKQAPSGKMSEDSSLADGGSAANPQVLCPESDPEDNGIAPALDDLGAWVLSSFEDLQVDTPPTQPTPDASQKMQSKVADVFSAANVDPTSNNAIPGPGNAQHSVAEFVISDDSDLDRQLEAFDIDDQDIMILSDDDDNNDDDDDNTGERLAGSAVDVFNRKQQPLPLTQGPQTPSNYLDKLSGRTRMTLNSSPPSSSPVRMTRKRQLHSLSGSFENAESDVSGPAKRINMDCDLSSSPIGRIPKRLVRGKPLDTRQPTVSAANSNGPNKISRSIEPTRSPPVQQLKQIKARKLRPPPKQARNMFIDTEAGVGDSDDECDARAGKRARNGIDVSEDESDGEDLNQDLSSFVVDDDHVEFTSPDVLNRSANGSGALLGSGLDETPTRNSGDIYRRSLNESPITPMSEIMRRLAEREKTRRWVSDTPTKHHKPAGRNALDLRQSEAHDPDSDDGNDNKEDGSSSEDEADFARSSSEFDNVEDMFSQAG